MLRAAHPQLGGQLLAAVAASHGPDQRRGGGAPGGGQHILLEPALFGVPRNNEPAAAATCGQVTKVSALPDTHLPNLQKPGHVAGCGSSPDSNEQKLHQLAKTKRWEQYFSCKQYVELDASCFEVL